MLFISLIVSAFLLGIANWIAWRSRHAGAQIVCTALACMVGPFFLMCVLPAVALQSLLLCGATVAWRATRRGPAFFLLLSCAATLVAYAVAGILVIQSEREYALLRGRYSFESMEERLPPPKIIPAAASLTAASGERLDRLEAELREHHNGFREFQLKTLHENTVSLFINSRGFGVARMLHPSEAGLSVNLRRQTVPLQPGGRSSTMWSPGDAQQLPAADFAPLGRMLEASFLDFVNPRGFGYIKDRQHVAGFETHRFGEVPAPANRWSVQTLELVSLLLHDEPEVYVSPDLPKMDRLHGVPTRPLDRFEHFGLDSLRQGEDIVTTQEREAARMLGAVRSTRQCIGCHGGKRGDLLGAFSYVLRPDGA